MHQIVAVRDAMGIRNDQRRTVVSFGFEKRLYGLSVVGAHGNMRDVDGSVGHGHHPQILLGAAFSRRGELRHCAAWSGFRHLAAGIRVDLGIQHQDLYIAAGSEDMIQAAVADVVSPSIPSYQPDALPHQCAGEGSEITQAGIVQCANAFVQRRYSPALFLDTRFRGLIRRQNRLHQLVSDLGREALQQFSGELSLLIERDAQAQAKLSIVLKQRIRPSRTAAVAVDGVGRGGQVSAIN